MRQPTQKNPTISRAIHAVKRVFTNSILSRRLIARAPGFASIHKRRLHELPPLRERSRHKIAAIGHAAAPALEQRQHRAISCRIARNIIDTRRPTVQHRSIALTAIAHLYPGRSLKQRIKTRPIHPRTGTGTIKRRQIEIHNIGFASLNSIVINTQTLRNPGAKIVNNNIGCLNQLHKSCLASLVFQIQNHAAFAGANLQGKPTGNARTKIRFWRIDLNNLCPEFRQRARTGWSREHIGQIQNANTLQDGAFRRRSDISIQFGFNISHKRSRRPGNRAFIGRLGKPRLHAELPHRTIFGIVNNNSQSRLFGLGFVQPRLCRALNRTRHASSRQNIDPVLCGFTRQHTFNFLSCFEIPFAGQMG